MITLRPLNRSDIIQFYGEEPYCSVYNGIVALKDGEPIGIGGTYISNNKLFVFSDMKPVAFQYRKSIIKAAYRVLSQVSHRVLYAQAAYLESAPRFLAHLGFELINEEHRLYMRMPH